MHVADSHRRAGNRSLDDFVAASSERSDEDILDTEDDDLHLANVSNDQVYQNWPDWPLEAYLCLFQVCLPMLVADFDFGDTIYSQGAVTSHSRTSFSFEQLLTVPFAGCCRAPASSNWQ